MLTFIWYLNDISEGGHTEFNTGFKVQPELGKLVIFPGLWPWVHRGNAPKSEVKYICTGWVTEAPMREYLNLLNQNLESKNKVVHQEEMVRLVDEK